VGEHHGPLDHFEELAYVARPVMHAQLAKRARRERAWLPAGRRLGLEEVLGQHRNVRGALAERRQAERQHVEAEVEVAAEATCGHERLDVGFVAAMMRTSARRNCSEPSGLYVRSSRKRSSFDCRPDESASISSRNSTPPSASAARPRCARASVNAPAA
jgi:hypothetical protein